MIASVLLAIAFNILLPGLALKSYQLVTRFAKMNFFHIRSSLEVFVILVLRKS